VSRHAPTIDARLEALARARDLGEGRLPEATAAGIGELLERAARRRSLSSEHTVVGFFGATGSGKSSLFNAVAGRELARVAVTRPTTSAPLAGVWGAEGSGALLDWLEVAQRHELEQPLAGAQAAGPEGLILLDLPDLDSTAVEHRRISERLAGKVDVLVWVLDPQKYADAAVHHGFIRPMAAHGAVTLVVLNQIDRLRSGQLEPVLGSLRRLLEQDGLTGMRILPVSARTGEGVARLREEIARISAGHGAATERLRADLGVVAGQLAAGLGESPKPLAAPDAAAERRLAEQLAQAAGVDVVVRAAERSYRMHASARTGWPLTRWLRKFHPDPLRRLHLGGDAKPEVSRTALPPLGAAQQAQADSAVRAYADAASHGAPEAWRASVRRAARASAGALPDALDQAIARTELGAGRGAWWWPLAGGLQWLALATATAGFLWLGVLFVLGYLQLAVPRAPTVEGVPVPTAMIGGGLLFGMVLAAFARFVSRFGSKLRGRAASRRLRASVMDVAHELVAAPVAGELERYRSFLEAVDTVRG
jgi:GTP-binding protein EngB required for normal cell division